MKFLFFELSAVGFLGLASTLFKEKQMGVILVHSTLPVSQTYIVLSKLVLFLAADLIFAALLTLVNLGVSQGLSVLPAVMIQAGILSVVMALTGFFCAVCLQGFRQFSLLYLILAVFVTTPVFLAGADRYILEMDQIPSYVSLVYGLLKTHIRHEPAGNIYYAVCAAAVLSLFMLICRTLKHEMAKEG